MAEEEKDLSLREEKDGSVIVGEEPGKNDTPLDDDDHSESAGALASADDSDDETGHADESHEDAEERRERNRQRRLEGKQKRKDYIESLKRDLAARDSVINDLSQRVAQVERRATGGEMAQLEAAEKEALAHYNQFKSLSTQAIEAADGKTATAAQERMFEARQRVEQIRGIKQAMTNQQQAPQPLDPRLVNHAQEWVSERSWYDPSGTDIDSDMVLKLDARLAQEGWNPTTKEYWDELGKRVDKYLPHRAKSGYNSSKNQGSMPVAGSSRDGSTSSSSQGAYKLSSDRVQALKDAGMWDDPKQRAAAIQRFKQFDKEQRSV